MSESPEPLPIDPNEVSAEVPAILIRQPIGDIYVCSMPRDLICRVTDFDVRRVITEERDVERYLGIQRPLDPRRVADLQKYVNYIDATFPTSIILAVDEEYASYDPVHRKVFLTNVARGEDKPTVAFRSLCRVLDGQHRIAGLGRFVGKDFDVSVTMFIGSDISDQAYVFATVNLQQTKVNPSLAYDLFELARSRSPEKTCHNIAIGLDRKSDSPFYKRIKRLGVATEGREDANETLTQSTFVNALIRYITDDRKTDRDLILRGREPSRVSGQDEQRLFLRNLFIGGEDVKIARIIEQYFLAVSNRWPEAWNYRGKGLMLNRTNGFRALMRFFANAYKYLGLPGDLVPSSKYVEIFNRSDVPSSFFNVESFRPGSAGEAALYKFLRESLLPTTA